MRPQLSFTNRPSNDATSPSAKKPKEQHLRKFNHRIKTLPHWPAGEGQNRLRGLSHRTFDPLEGDENRPGCNGDSHTGIKVGRNVCVDSRRIRSKLIFRTFPTWPAATAASLTSQKLDPPPGVEPVHKVTDLVCLPKHGGITPLIWQSFCFR